MKQRSFNIGTFYKLFWIISTISTAVYAKPKPSKSPPLVSQEMPSATTTSSDTQTLNKVTSVGEPNLNSKQAILVDVLTGDVLFEKNADEIMAPSSMSKVMTVYLVFEALKAGRITLSTMFNVSEKAWRKQGSKMFLALNEQVSVENLLRGAIIQSGNDACIALAEGLSGSEENFADNMNQVAKELKMLNSNFVNSTGWPHESHHSTARDLSIISQKTIEKHPTYYPLYAERQFVHQNISQMNRNPLLGSFPGADGLKTGSTEAGGYGLIGSAVQNGHRLIMVTNGAKSKKDRAADSKSLLQWGFHNFVSLELYKKGEVIAQADVWLGDKKHVNLIAKDNIYLSIPRSDLKKIKITLTYKSPLTAPLKANQAAGQLIISRPLKPDVVVPVLIQEDIAKAGLLLNMKTAFLYILRGHH